MRLVDIYKLDIKMIKRDFTLLYSLVFVIALLFVIRYLKTKVPIGVYPGMTTLSFVLIPMIFGMIPGFLFSDEKEDLTIQALQVLPISTLGFLSYRLFWNELFTIIISSFVPKILDISLPLKAHIFIIIILCLQTLFFALFISAFAETRMQALTLIKILGWIIMIPIFLKILVIARNLSFDLSKLTIFIPSYWFYKLYEDIAKGDYTNTFLITVFVHLVWIFAFSLKFKKKVL